MRYGLWVVLGVLLFGLVGSVGAETDSKTETYTQPGTHTKCVTAFDVAGASSVRVCKSVNVRGNTPPVVVLVAEPATGIGTLTTTFTATATDAEGDPVTFTWDDGTP